MSNSKIPLKPVGGRILVKPLEAEETTPSGLIISSTAKTEKPQKGEVVALGTGKKDKEGKIIPFGLAVGDKVFFKKYSPDEFEHDGVNYLIMEEDDVLAVIQD